MVQKLSDIRPEEIYERELTSFSRESILKSELQDFERLKNFNFLKDVENIIINRYKLEKRNSFNREVDKKFLVVWESIEELSNFLDSQLDFYENRIFKIKCELKELSDG